MLFRYMLKELKNSPRFALLFILNMSLGLLGFIALDALKRNFDERLNSSARTLLGADLSISARRELAQNELPRALEVLPKDTRSQLMITLYTMAATNEKSSLVDLRTVDEDYPYYGEIVLKEFGPKKDTKDLAADRNLWVAPEVALKLDLKVGSTLKIGKLDFRVSAIIEDDNASSFGAGMAPRIYMSRKHLAETGLMAEGNTATHTLLFQIPSTLTPEDAVKSLKAKIPDPSLRIRTFQESGQDNGRMLNYLSDYLGLVALVALSLAGIGAAYLYQNYFDRRSASLAVLISLGLTHAKALRLYIFQIIVLGTLSSLLATLLSLGLLPMLGKLVKEFSPVSFTPYLPWQTFALALLLGAFGSILICLPVLQRLKHLNPTRLFHEGASSEAIPGIARYLTILPVLLAFWGLSLWQAHSIKVGSLFFGLSVLFALAIGAFAGVFLLLAKSFRRSKNLPLRTAALFLRAHPSSTVSAFLAIGLGSTLMNLIPQLQGSLLRELDKPAGGSLPSFFLFDIQEDQLEPLTSQLQALDAAPQSTSAMIMARLTKINGAAFLRKDDSESGETREEEREQNSRNRGVNLSYRMNLAKGESLVEGRMFEKPYSGEGLGEVSLEKNYASRLGLKLGDTMTFNVQGLEIEAKVTSLRQVKWNTFEPNFFIVLQPGLIDDAPKTFLMNIPERPLEQKVKTQQSVVQSFPNVSIIDVTALIKRIEGIVTQMALVLNVMAYLTVLTGMLVIYSIAQHQALSRRWDHNLLKILGAKFSDLWTASALEFLSISGMAGILGSLFGLFASFTIAKVLFKGIWVIQWQEPLALTAGIMLLCLITTWIATSRILKEKPRLQIEA